MSAEKSLVPCRETTCWLDMKYFLGHRQDRLWSQTSAAEEVCKVLKFIAFNTSRTRIELLQWFMNGNPSRSISLWLDTFHSCLSGELKAFFTSADVGLTSSWLKIHVGSCRLLAFRKTLHNFIFYFTQHIPLNSILLKKSVVY